MHERGKWRGGRQEEELGLDAIIHADAGGTRHADPDADAALGRAARVPGAPAVRPRACLRPRVPMLKRRLCAQDDGALPNAADVIPILLEVQTSLGMCAPASCPPRLPRRQHFWQLRPRPLRPRFAVRERRPHRPTGTRASVATTPLGANVSLGLSGSGACHARRVTRASACHARRVTRGSATVTRLALTRRA